MSHGSSPQNTSRQNQGVVDDKRSAAQDSNGESFLFIGGREFRINQTDHGDKQPGKEDVVTLGEGSTAVDPTFHDPQKPYGTAEPLIEDLDKYPVWLRFDPVDGKDNWHLDRALVEVFAKGALRHEAWSDALSRVT